MNAETTILVATEGVTDADLVRDLLSEDVNLPDIDRVEVMRRIKSAEQFAAIPIIMITDQSDKSVVVDSLKAGVTDFVVKPFSKEVLRAKLDKYLSMGNSR